ncbi:MAG: VanW family protein [Firmicutes bacterium]|nr:VanW family protein [Bacillota bacterium]
MKRKNAGQAYIPCIFIYIVFALTLLLGLAFIFHQGQGGILTPPGEGVVFQPENRVSTAQSDAGVLHSPKPDGIARAATGQVPLIVGAPDRRAQIDLTYAGRTYRYTDELIEPTDHLVAEEIHTRKINAPLPEKLRLTDKCAEAGGDIKKAMLYTFPLLAKTVDCIVTDIDAPPVDSVITFAPNRRPMFTVSREQNGFEVNEESLYRDIYTHLRRGAKSPLPVRPKILSPSVTSFDNLRLTDLRSRFTTDYSSSGEDRKHNVALALSKINGITLLSGAEFSFNKAVGKRSEANGFRTAKIIMDGEYVDGVGGGVCQASTTVYNAALLADMAITQARSHSLVPSYVLPSMDAMVNSGSSDLRFKNAGSTPVFIRAYGDGRTACVEIYGAPLQYRIKTESVTLSSAPPPPDREQIDYEYKYLAPGSLPGERMAIALGHGALKSEGYLCYYDAGGRLIEKKQIRKDAYQSVAGVVMVAPGQGIVGS